jgi:hypothetical protein
MRRTQLYLDDDLSNALHARARTTGTSISELVRQAVREKYFSKLEERKKAMADFVGIRKDRAEFADPEGYVRNLRRGSRLDRLSGA